MTSPVSRGFFDEDVDADDDDDDDDDVDDEEAIHEEKNSSKSKLNSLKRGSIRRTICFLVAASTPRRDLSLVLSNVDATIAPSEP